MENLQIQRNLKDITRFFFNLMGKTKLQCKELQDSDCYESQDSDHFGGRKGAVNCMRDIDGWKSSGVFTL